jgi:hypothetical protein
MHPNFSTYGELYKVYRSASTKPQLFPRFCQRCRIETFTDFLAAKTKKKLHGLSPRANYTDRVTAVCQRFADRGCHVVSVTDLYDRILGFIDRSRYFSIN